MSGQKAGREGGASAEEVPAEDMTNRQLANWLQYDPEVSIPKDVRCEAARRLRQSDPDLDSLTPKCPVCRRPVTGRPLDALQENGDKVDVFSEAMRERLAANDHKGGWKHCHPYTLLNRVMGELDELYEELFPPHDRDPEKILREAADAANYAMMVADVAGGLRGVEESGVPERVRLALSEAEERIVEIEERAERGWYMPSDVAYLLKVAKAVEPLFDGEGSYAGSPAQNIERLVTEHGSEIMQEIVSQHFAAIRDVLHDGDDAWRYRSYYPEVPNTEVQPVYARQEEGDEG